MADEHATLSAAEVEAIRERNRSLDAYLRESLVSPPPGLPTDTKLFTGASTASDDIDTLLATLDAYREIVAAVAGAHAIPRGRAGDTVEAWVCHFCEADADGGVHTADCPVTRARALLAQE